MTEICTINQLTCGLVFFFLQNTSSSHWGVEWILPSSASLAAWLLPLALEDTGAAGAQNLTCHPALLTLAQLVLQLADAAGRELAGQCGPTSLRPLWGVGGVTLQYTGIPAAGREPWPAWVGSMSGCWYDCWGSPWEPWVIGTWAKTQTRSCMRRSFGCVPQATVVSSKTVTLWGSGPSSAFYQLFHTWQTIWPLWFSDSMCIMTPPSKWPLTELQEDATALGPCLVRSKCSASVSFEPLSFPFPGSPGIAVWTTPPSGFLFWKAMLSFWFYAKWPGATDNKRGSCPRNLPHSQLATFENISYWAGGRDGCNMNKDGQGRKTEDRVSRARGTWYS